MPTANCAAPRRRPPSRPRRAAPRPGAAQGPSNRDDHAEIRCPRRSSSGTDGWRAKIAAEFTFRKVRRCADGVAEYVVERGEQAIGRSYRLRPPVARSISGCRGGGPAGATSRRVRGARGAYADVVFEVVERGSAAGIVITASQTTGTDNGFKVKSAEGSAAGDILKVLEARIARTGGTAIPRRPFRGRRSGRSRGALRPIRRLRGLLVRHRRPRTAPQGGGPAHLVERCGRRRGLDLGGFWPAEDPRHRRSTRSATRTSRREPGARSGPTSMNRWACSPAAATTWACSLDGDADRAGAADGDRADSSISWRSSAC